MKSFFFLIQYTSELRINCIVSGGMGPLEHNNNVGSSNSNSPTQLNNSPSQVLRNYEYN